MRVILTVTQIFFWMFVLGQSGCEQATGVAELPAKVDTRPVFGAYADYTPDKIHITPLTEFLSVGDAKGDSKIVVYVSLLDSFGSQVKSPGVFRFELYEYAQRSAEPKGRRVVIWSDIDVTGASDNNKYWHDFLRAYQFSLPLTLPSDQNYVLQVTFLSVSGKRLSDELTLKPTK